MAILSTGEHFRPIKEHWILPQMNSVGAGLTAYVNLPTGVRYHNILIAYSGTTFDYTKMNAIRLYCNNDLIQTISGTVRNVFNQFLNMPAAAAGGPGILELPFERMGMADLIERYRTCINTGDKSIGGAQAAAGILNVRLEIDIDGTAVAPAIALYADVSDVNVEQSVLLPRIDTWQEPIVAGGEYLHNNTPKKILGDAKRPFTERIWMVDTIAHITAFRFKENGRETFNRPTTLNEARQKAWGKRTPQAGYVVYDPAEEGETNNFLHGLQLGTFDFYSTHAAAATTPLTMYSESMGPL
jgi:hypothetical protein